MSKKAEGHPEKSGILTSKDRNDYVPLRPGVFVTEIVTGPNGALHVDMDINMSPEATYRSIKRTLMLYMPDKFPLAEVLYGEGDE